MYTEAYKNALCLLCRQSAIVESYVCALKNGFSVNEENMKRHLDLFARAKERFLAAKKDLGFKDGIAFLQEDVTFQEFRYRRGQLVGDYTHLADILIPWMELPESAANHYKYEVSTLLMSHYFMQKGEYDYAEEVEETDYVRENIIKRVCRRICLMLRRGGSSPKVGEAVS